MRDGNSVVRYKIFVGGLVLRLPMRDGNHPPYFLVAADMMFLDYL